MMTMMIYHFDDELVKEEKGKFDDDHIKENDEGKG